MNDVGWIRDILSGDENPYTLVVYEGKASNWEGIARNAKRIVEKEGELESLGRVGCYAGPLSILSYIFDRWRRKIRISEKKVRERAKEIGVPWEVLARYVLAHELAHLHTYSEFVAELVALYHVHLNCGEEYAEKVAKAIIESSKKDLEYYFFREAYRRVLGNEMSYMAAAVYYLQNRPKNAEDAEELVKEAPRGTVVLRRYLKARASSTP